VVDKVYKEALKTITEDISDATKLMAKRKQVVGAFKESYGVTEAELLKVIGKASIDHIDADNLVTLIGIGQAIKDGDTSVEEAFRGKNKETKPTTATATAEVEKIEVKETQALKDKREKKPEKKEEKKEEGQLPLTTD
jgi:hypothetical protein